MRIEDEDGLRTITFDRPNARNAVTADVAHDLISGLDDLDPSTTDAVVITGEGDVFSAGGDIRAMADRSETAKEAYDRVRETLGGVAERLLDAPVPIIAKVNGDAVGAGTSLVAAADFAYAAESARFGATFINVGLVPDMGGTVTLPRLIGLRVTKELVFTGELIGAETAAEIGLVNAVAGDDSLDELVDDCLERIAEHPTENIGLTKRVLHENIGQSVHEGLRREAHYQTLAYDTEGHREGVSAFLENREPDFDS